MIFSLAIYSPPSSQASYTAFRFAESLLQQGHTLHRVFFYHDGAYHGSPLVCPPQDEFNLTEAWSQLAAEFTLDIVVCIAAGLKRGILNDEEALRYEQPTSNLSDTMELSGLGQLVEASIVSDRIITFGG
jgi:tRNA 2-thiouridine synthesizing protein D